VESVAVDDANEALHLMRPGPDRNSASGTYLAFSRWRGLEDGRQREAENDNEGKKHRLEASGNQEGELQCLRIARPNEPGMSSLRGKGVSGGGRWALKQR